MRRTAKTAPRLSTILDPAIKKWWATPDIAMDAIKLADKLDVIVLVSGDGDYLPLVSYLQNTKGCLVEVVGFRQTTSSRLIDEADDFINLSENDSYLLK